MNALEAAGLSLVGFVYGGVASGMGAFIGNGGSISKYTALGSIGSIAGGSLAMYSADPSNDSLNAIAFKCGILVASTFSTAIASLNLSKLLTKEETSFITGNSISIAHIMAAFGWKFIGPNAGILTGGFTAFLLSIIQESKILRSRQQSTTT